MKVKTLGRAPGNTWQVSPGHVNMAPAAPPRQRLVRVAAAPQSVTLDLASSALLIVDMMNDFCSEGGLVDSRGGDFAAGRAPIEPLQRLLPALRRAGTAIVWVNWGNRPDRLNLAPNQLHAFDRDGTGIGICEVLPGNGSHALEKDSWSAAVVSDLEPEPTDIEVDKYRTSGFWHTTLDSILRNLGVKTLLFGGVNIDQCVMCTLQDASFLGYGCFLLRDCCATTSPQFCTDATLWNVEKCFGFVSDSGAVLEALKGAGEGPA